MSAKEVRIVDSSRSNNNTAGSSSFEIPSTWVINDSDDEMTTTTEPRSSSAGLRGTEADDANMEVPPPEQTEGFAANPDSEGDIVIPEFTQHVNTRGHQAICEVLLPALFVVLRDPSMQHMSPRDHVRMACQSFLSEQYFQFSLTTELLLFYLFFGSCISFKNYINPRGTLLRHPTDSPTKMWLMLGRNSGASMTSTRANVQQKIKYLGEVFNFGPFYIPYGYLLQQSLHRLGLFGLMAPH